MVTVGAVVSITIDAEQDESELLPAESSVDTMKACVVPLVPVNARVVDEDARATGDPDVIEQDPSA